MLLRGHVLCLGLAACLSACYSTGVLLAPPNVETVYDEAAGETVRRTNPVRLLNPTAGEDYTVSYHIESRCPGADCRPSSAEWVVTTNGDRPRHASLNDRTFVLLVDGERVDMEPTGYAASAEGTGVTEVLRYDAPALLLRIVGAAADVDALLDGREIPLSYSQREAVRLFTHAP